MEVFVDAATKQIEQFQLRMPGDLREKLRARATANRRSLNSEIVVCLERVVASAAGDDPNEAR
ncbi:Arc family DNA-binding protein [Sinorhizobium fredii]|uniref:Arc family DNA-binding protein n=1 Tax=Rhizobium fredii TaxID=380 RepID=UPI0009B6C12F